MCISKCGKFSQLLFFLFFFLSGKIAINKLNTANRACKFKHTQKKYQRNVMLLFACSSEELAEQQKRSTQLLSYQSIFIANWHQTYHGNFMSFAVLRCIEQYFIQCYTGEKEHAHAHSHSVSLFPYLAGGCTKRCYEKSSVESDLCVVYQLFCCWVGYLLFLSEEAWTMDETKNKRKNVRQGHIDIDLYNIYTVSKTNW